MNDRLADVLRLFWRASMAALGWVIAIGGVAVLWAEMIGS